MVYKKAFTIIELLVVIVIIGILAAVVMVSYSNISQRAIVSSLQTDLANAKKQIVNFQIQTGYFPTAINCVSPSSTEICLKASNGAVFTYSPFNSTPGTSFYLALNTGSIGYFITDSGVSTISNTAVSNGNILLLDSGNTSSYSGSGTNWQDLSGQNYNSSLFGGVSYSSSNGGSLLFDGTSGYATIPNLTSSITNAFTINVWIKASLNNNAFDISNQYQWDSGILTGWRLRQEWSTYSFRVGNGTAIVYICSGGVVGINQWSHVVAIWDGTYERIYVNGSMANSCQQSITYANNNNIHTIGKYAGSAYFFPGNISQVSIYNRALTSAEVLQNFNALRGRYGL